MFESEQWDTILFGNVTLRELLIYVAVGVVGLWILRKLYILIFGSSRAEYTVPGRCMNCRWEGKVSKYKGVCPKCGSKVRIIDPRRKR